MLNLDSSAVREALWSARFGLEREALRVTEDGRMAHTPHPFPADHPRIVRDFCENQTEINTRVHASAAGAVAELEAIDRELRAVLAALPRPERLWLCSNPPPLAGGEDVPIARFSGPRAGKTAYREHLAARYGRRKMAFSGVHVNLSFGADLLAANFAAAGGAGDPRRHADSLYCELAAHAADRAWLPVALAAASPLADASLFGDPPPGAAVPRAPLFAGFASIRCSELGYWNDFVPVFDYADAPSWERSVARYAEAGLIAAPSELYHPVRLKPRGANVPGALAAGGVDRVELRMFDVNPFAPAGVDARDAVFAHAFLVRLAALPRAPHPAREQIAAVRNAKAAARYDLASATVLHPDGRAEPVHDAALRALDDLEAFLRPLDPPREVVEAVAFQRGKLETPGARYAERVLAALSGRDYRSAVLSLAPEVPHV
jgi:glutamate--cysteine ligase